MLAFDQVGNRPTTSRLTEWHYPSSYARFISNQQHAVVRYRCSQSNSEKELTNITRGNQTKYRNRYSVTDSGGS